MSAWEALMWRADGDRRTRSTGVVVEMLDREPEWDRLVAAPVWVSRRVPQLRERVVEPLLPLVAPVSYEGTCCIGVNLDPDAITDGSLFTACRREGFDEVLALAP